MEKWEETASSAARAASATVSPAQGAASKNTVFKGGKRGAKGATTVNLAALIVAGLVAGVISLFFLAESLAALGIPDPGRLTTFGLPFFRGVAWVLMALSVGSYMVSAFLVAPQIPEKDNDRLIESRLSVDGHIAARTGALAAFGVVVVSLLEVPLVMSDLTGTTFLKVLNPQLMGMALDSISTSQAWLVTAALAVVAGVLGLVSKKWSLQPIAFFFALMQIVPLGMEGHSASGGDHDYGTNSLLFHLFFMVLWVGGLLGLIAHSRRLGPGMPTAVRRYSVVAFISIVAMAASGVINALIRVELADLFSTRYGLIIVAKAVLTVLLAVFGLAHRQITMPQLERRPLLFRRVAFVEILVMAATVGVAISMGRTPPPPPRDPNLNNMQVLLGYELLDAPTVTNVWTMYRYDLMFGTLGLVLAAAYGYALLRLRRRGLNWSRARTTWFMLGALGLTFIMSSGIGLYIPALYSMHMLGHMLLSMAVPLFLVLGAPLTLVMEAFEPGAPGRPTVHDLAVAVTKSKLLKFLTHPAVNLIQFLTFLYVLYLYPELYQFAVSEHAGHVIMNWVFLVSGYIYYWEVIGPDPLPFRAPTNLRLLVLFFSMPLHLFAGVYLMQLQSVLGVEFYESLGLPWHSDLLQDQRVGGGIAWGFGQFPLVIVFGKLFLDWLRDDRATARRHDAKAEVDGDAELEDYNEMLRRMSEGDATGFRQQ